MTAYEFILKCNGTVTYQGEKFKLLTSEKYVEHVKKYIVNKEKQEILLSKVIPDRFGNNQLKKNINQGMFWSFQVV